MRYPGCICALRHSRASLSNGDCCQKGVIPFASDSHEHLTVHFNLMSTQLFTDFPELSCLSYVCLSAYASPLMDGES